MRALRQHKAVVAAFIAVACLFAADISAAAMPDMAGCDDMKTVCNVCVFAVNAEGAASEVDLPRNGEVAFSVHMHTRSVTDPIFHPPRT